jgi:hypothetical protein
MKFNLFRIRDGPALVPEQTGDFTSWLNTEPSPVPVAATPEKSKPKSKSLFTSSHLYGMALEKKGFKLIGNGYYSKVYAKDGSDKVIKVGRTPATDGWLEYIDWATQKGQLGKFAPMVFSYKYHSGEYVHDGYGKWEWTSFYVAVVERLDKRARDLDRKSPVKALPMVFEYADNGIVEEVMDRLTPGLGSFSKDFLRDFESGGIDVHADNIMLRKNGEIVINDPLSSKRQPYKSRRKAHDFMPKAA